LLLLCGIRDCGLIQVPSRIKRASQHVPHIVNFDE
jgi:hypothetical protein